jgi:uncharacterized membrane protein YraQ (UPF0718 family)
MMPSAWIVVAAVVVSGLFGTWVGNTFKQAEWDASVLAKKSGEDAALRAAAEAIAKIEVKSEKHIQPVRLEIRTNTVYRDCKHSDDSLRNLNSLITGKPVDSGELPGADSSR